MCPPYIVRTCARVLLLCKGTEFFEKKTKSTKTEIIELTEEMEEKLGIYVEEIEELIQQEKV